MSATLTVQAEQHVQPKQEDDDSPDASIGSLSPRGGVGGDGESAGGEETGDKRKKKLELNRIASRVRSRVTCNVRMSLHPCLQWMRVVYELMYLGPFSPTLFVCPASLMHVVHPLCIATNVN